MKKTIYAVLFVLLGALFVCLFELLATQAEKEAAGEAEYLEDYLCKIEKNCD